MITQPFVETLGVHLNPPLSWAVCGANALSGISLLFMVQWSCRADMGWEPSTRRSRVLMLALSAWFIVNAVGIYFSPSVSVRVLVLSGLAAAVFVNMLYEYWRKSRRHADRNLAAVRQAYDSLEHRGKLPEGAVRP